MYKHWTGYRPADQSRRRHRQLACRVLWDDHWNDRLGGLLVDMPPSYRGFRYPVEVIAHAVWLYHRFPL
ncbi:hypothetical protein AB0L75_42920, partial [Streptomyces sp. NPDC052101]